MPWSTPAATDSSAHHFARPSACATSVAARHSRVWPQRGTSCVAGTFGCAFRSPLQTRIGTGTGIRPPCLPERTSVTGRRSRTRAGSAGKRPATHTGSLLPVSKRRGHPGGEVNAGGFGGQSPTTRARSAHDIKPRRFLQYSAGRYTPHIVRSPRGREVLIVRAFTLLLLDYKLCSDSSVVRWPERAWCLRGASGAEQRDVLRFDVASRQNQIDSLIEFGDRLYPRQ